MTDNNRTNQNTTEQTTTEQNAPEQNTKNENVNQQEFEIPTPHKKTEEITTQNGNDENSSNENGKDKAQEKVNTAFDEGSGNSSKEGTQHQKKDNEREHLKQQVGFETGEKAKQEKTQHVKQEQNVKEQNMKEQHKRMDNDKQREERKNPDNPVYKDVNTAKDVKEAAKHAKDTDTDKKNDWQQKKMNEGYNESKTEKVR